MVDCSGQIVARRMLAVVEGLFTRDIWIHIANESTNHDRDYNRAIITHELGGRCFCTDVCTGDWMDDCARRNNRS